MEPMNKAEQLFLKEVDKILYDSTLDRQKKPELLLEAFRGAKFQAALDEKAPLQFYRPLPSSEEAKIRIQCLEYAVKLSTQYEMVEKYAMKMYKWVTQYE